MSRTRGLQLRNLRARGRPALRQSGLGWGRYRLGLQPFKSELQTVLFSAFQAGCAGDKKRESHFLFCTPHPCPEWGVSLYFEKCLPAFCVVGGIDCVRDSKVGTP